MFRIGKCHTSANKAFDQQLTPEIRNAGKFKLANK